jgi:hypothetical protein
MLAAVGEASGALGLCGLSAESRVWCDTVGQSSAAADKTTEI